jgi:hypothetical protein
VVELEDGSIMAEVEMPTAGIAFESDALIAGGERTRSIICLFKLLLFASNTSLISLSK